MGLVLSGLHFRQPTEHKVGEVSPVVVWVVVSGFGDEVSVYTT